MSAAADEPAQIPGAGTASQPNWSAEIDLKLALTRGNTDISSGDFNLLFGRIWPYWSASVTVDAAGASLDNDVIAESALIDLMAVRQLNGRLGLVGEIDAYKNRFAGIDWRTTAAAGVAWSAFAEGSWTLDTMVGVGWQAEEPVDFTEADRSYPIGVIQVRGIWVISANTTVRPTVYWAPDLGDPRNSLLYARLTWRTNTNRWLSVEIDYVLRHDTDPVLGTDSTDQALKAGFVFSFGRTTGVLVDNLLLPPR